MASEAELKKQLATWLEPYVLDLTEPVLAARTAAVNDIAAELAGPMILRAVQAAHGATLSNDDRIWLGGAVRNHDDTFVDTGKDGLLGVLVAAAVWAALSKAPSTRRGTLAYGVQSAAFCGLDPKIPGLAEHAAAAIHDTALATRRRPTLAFDAKVVVTTAMEKAAAAESDQAVAAINALAKHIDTALTAVSARQLQIDEELDLLWWSAQGANSKGERWSTMAPAPRALAAARELQRKSASYVLPPAGVALLDTALGRSAKTEMSIADFVRAAPDTADGSLRHQAMPITACRAVISEIGAEDDAWMTVVSRSAGVDATAIHSLLELAVQMSRELAMRVNLELA